MEDAPQASDRPRSAITDKADKDALDALQFHWGEAYEIGHDESRGWWARRRDGLGEELTAATAEELITKIAADYALRSVGRDYSAPLAD